MAKFLQPTCSIHLFMITERMRNKDLSWAKTHFIRSEHKCKQKRRGLEGSLESKLHNITQNPRLVCDSGEIMYYREL